MIVFDLRCAEGCATFEGWFDSSSDYEQQSKRGLVQCPYCGSGDVQKAPMAPRVSRSEDTAPQNAIAALAAIQARSPTWIGRVMRSKPGLDQSWLPVQR